MPMDAWCCMDIIARHARWRGSILVLPFTSWRTESCHIMDLDSQNPAIFTARRIIASIAVLLLAVAGGMVWYLTPDDPKPTVPLNPIVTPAIKVPASVADLLAMTPAELVGVDIGRMNLICAQGLRGSEKLDLSTNLRQLDAWAERVNAETNRFIYQFTEKPEDYKNSEGYFRIMMMITVLQQDLGVHYNMARVNSPDFSNSQDVFIHGMIGSDNGGTCSSMPILYAAIARRLGYPVFIVKAKEHLFCRWDGVWRGKSDRFNIEGAGQGMNSFPDEHYLTWPHPISPAEVKRGEYLRSLDPSETLAMCLAARAYVLEDNGDITAASAMYAEAAKRDAKDAMYPRLASRSEKHTKPKAARLAFQPPLDGDPQSIMDFNRRNQGKAAVAAPLQLAEQ